MVSRLKMYDQEMNYDAAAWLVSQFVGVQLGHARLGMVALAIVVAWAT